MISFPQNIIANALSYLGCKETTANAGKCISMIRTEAGFSDNTVFWCSQFVSGVLNKSFKSFGSKMIRTENKNKIYSPLWSASSLELLNQAKKNNIKINNTASIGSVFVYNRDGGGHTGFVADVLDDKKFITVEGNFNDKVAIVERNTNEKNFQFIHIEEYFGTKSIWDWSAMNVIKNSTYFAGGVLTWLAVAKLIKNKKII